MPAISQLAPQLNDLDLTPEQNKQIVLHICQSALSTRQWLAFLSLSSARPAVS